VSGRAVEDDDYPRYKIYKSEWASVIPGYSLDKSKILWGLNDFYSGRMTGCSPNAPVVVCEGFKAALWVRQAGYSDSVALIGAAMSNIQKCLLERVTNSVVLFLDNDEPGRKATARTLRSLRKTRLDVRVVNYGTNAPLSPDDLTPEDVLSCIAAAMPPMKWRK
jgi:DNA primase